METLRWWDPQWISGRVRLWFQAEWLALHCPSCVLRCTPPSLLPFILPPCFTGEKHEQDFNPNKWHPKRIAYKAQQMTWTNDAGHMRRPIDGLPCMGSSQHSAPNKFLPAIFSIYLPDTLLSTWTMVKKIKPLCLGLNNTPLWIHVHPEPQRAILLGRWGLCRSN